MSFTVNTHTNVVLEDFFCTDEVYLGAHINSHINSQIPYKRKLIFSNGFETQEERGE